MLHCYYTINLAKVKQKESSASISKTCYRTPTTLFIAILLLFYPSDDFELFFAILLVAETNGSSF